MTTLTPAQIEAAIATAKGINAYEVNGGEYVFSAAQELADAVIALAEERDRLAKEVERLQAAAHFVIDNWFDLAKSEARDTLRNALSNTRQHTARGEERRVEEPGLHAGIGRRINPERRKPE